MRLKELRLNDFGKFHNKSILLKDGINLIYGENEAGKSTIHSFIKGMLFGIEKLRGRASREDAYVKFKPWDNPGSYSGSLDLEVEEKQFRILRSFDKNNKNCAVIDLETGRGLDLKPDGFMKFYGGLTEAGYRNTISIEQLKARTEQELVEEVRNYITNLSLSKSNEVDVTKALNFLQDRRKELEAQQLGGRLSALENEIEEGLKLEVKTDGLTLQLKETEEQEKILKKKKDLAGSLELPEGFPTMKAYQTYLEQFPVMKEKYKSYKEVKNQRDLLQEKQSAAQKFLQESEKESGAVIRKQLENLDTLKFEISTQEEKKAILMKDREKELQKDKKRSLLYGMPLIIISIMGFFVYLGKNNFFTGLCAAALLFGLAVYLAFTRRVHRKKINYNQNDSKSEKEISLLKEKVKDILMQFQAEDERTLKKKYEEALRREMEHDHLQKQKKDYIEQMELLNKRISALEQEILEYGSRSLWKFNTEVSEIVSLEDGVMEKLEEAVIQQKQYLARNQELSAGEYENCRIRKEKLRWELLSLEGNEEKLLQNQELYEELKQKKSENDLELEAVKLSIETINNLSVDIHDSFGRKLNTFASDLAGQVTGGKYMDIKIDEKLNVKVGQKDNFVLLDKLSAGTIEQLYFALRIAISDLIYGPGAMPILLDDCFALYDDNRTRAVLEFLTKKRQGQVLLFTCHGREKVILDGFQIKYHYIDLSVAAQKSED